MDDVGGNIQKNKNKAPRQALWLNKRALASIGFPFEHTLVPTTSGWDVLVEGEGLLLLTFGDGKRDAVRVGPGDRLQSSGDDLYVAIAFPLDASRDLAPAAEDRRPPVEPAPRSTAGRKATAKRAKKASAARKLAKKAAAR